MPYIVAQKIIKNDSGIIISGSASIVESVYVTLKDKNYHSKHKVREKLGKVIWLSDDKKSGIFDSPTRGIVEYNCVTDQFSKVESDDSRIKGNNVLFKKPAVHTVFGDSFFLLQFLKSSGMLSIFKKVFQKQQELERVICHILHGILKDGSRISCSNFISKSFLSSLLTSTPISTLDSDTSFFTLMGDDTIEMQFFKTFVSEMKRVYPDFGKCTYIDSTPLPNDISDNPLNFLCSDCSDAASVQSRLIFILDKHTGLPVWFQVLPFKILDFSTIKDFLSYILDYLEITVEQLVLDADYVTENLFDAQDDEIFKTFIARMPSKKGYPFKELYKECKNKFRLGRYSFVLNSQVYFGIKKSIELFGHKMNAYIYVDWANANNRRIEWETMNTEMVEKMTPSELDWLSVQFGYFVLLSNQNSTPKEILNEYFERTEIESVNKNSKDYGNLMPFNKWSYTSVSGKIMYDIINTIIIMMMRKKIWTKQTNIRSLSYFYGKAQSLMCIEHQGNIIVETPNEETLEAFKLMGLELATTLKIKTLRKEFLTPDTQY